MSEITYKISPNVSNEELNKLFAETWENHQAKDFQPILKKSLTYICAYSNDKLIGFVNLAWDGGIHAFILDTTVHPKFQRKGIGIKLVKKTYDIAKENGIEWIHVDFVPHLQDFYDKCGFKKTSAGLLNVNQI